MRPSKAMILPWLLSAAVCLSLGVFSSCTLNKEDHELKAASKFIERVHEIKLVHPGDPEAEVMTLDLIQKLDSEKNPVEYSLWLNSVICRDKTCDVVLVKLNWDALGRYQSYEVKKGFKLTKLDHVPFTDEDHKKLQAILKNKKSALSEATKEGLTGSKSQGIDGVSGATVLTLGEHVVLGAGYTCYDLWHWANGEVSEIIQEKSSEQLSFPKIREFLVSKDGDYIDVALKSLTQREIYSKSFVEATINAMKNGNDDLVSRAVKYLKEADGIVPYKDSFSKLLALSISGINLYLIESLYEYEKPPEDFVIAVSQHIHNFKKYQELHRFLTYLEDRNISNPQLLDNILKLLKHPKFFFSRRAYYFLENNFSGDKLKNELKEYYEKHEVRL